MKKDQESSSSVYTVENRKTSSSNIIDQQLLQTRLIFIEVIPARKIQIQQVQSQIDEAHHFLPQQIQVQLSEKKAAVDNAINNYYKAKGKVDR